MPVASYVDKTRPRKKAYPKKHCLKAGDRFGRLVVLGCPWKYDDTKKGHIYVSVRCDCGKGPLQVRVSHLATSTRSCGCLIPERVKQANTRHGESKTRLHSIWRSMRSRCTDVNTDKYPNYGGRGIKVCDQWSSFECFRDWALANDYSGSLSLDRIDVNGDYAPENCRWADQSTQSINQRPDRTHQGAPCSSRFRGVSFSKEMGKWRAAIVWRGNRRHLGYFDLEEDAALAYDKFAAKRRIPAPVNLPDH